MIANIPIKEMNDSMAYEFSCWFLLRREDCRSPGVTLEFFDRAGKKTGEQSIFTGASVDSYGLWFRSSKYFYLPAGCSTVRCVVINDPNPSYVAMDEIVLRPANALVISKAADGAIMANNHILKK